MALSRPRTHDFTCSQEGQDYVIDLLDSGTTGYMTGLGRGVKKGDRLILKRNSCLEIYQVEQIDYYANPSGTWVAQLVKAK